jgi:secernin
LALERSTTARAALEVITDLLARHGQGGSCGLTHPFFYHNSFLIADGHEAWVLETAGREWAAEQVRDVRAISNAITIGKSWDLASKGLVAYAVRRGWCRGSADFDFGRCYSDFIYTRFSAARARQCRTTELLAASKGRITLETMLTALRDHGSATPADWSPVRALAGADVCMHASAGPIRSSQSVGSLVSHLTPQAQTLWVTGTAAPCTGIFKPVWLDSDLPDLGPTPTARYDAAALWWQHEALHRAVLRDYAMRLNLYREERDALEADFRSGAFNGATRPAPERAAFSAQCFAKAAQATQRWTAQVQQTEIGFRAPFWADRAWRNFNRQAGFRG